ncbi:MAG: Bax inhibitor-1/YccA family protein, partial [Chloroflexi bacterium]|nr:Bax inhibitor-1/YccA family protein [Chloroflexota bacterium]
MRASNPVWNEAIVSEVKPYVDAASTMTLGGTLSKIAFLGLLMLSTALYSWLRIWSAPDDAALYIIVGGLGGLVVGFVITVWPPKAKWLAPIYALFEGTLVGSLSAVFERQYPGIVIQAVGLTLAIFFLLLLAYAAGWVKATDEFTLGVSVATGAILVLYLADFVLRLFGRNVPFIHETGWIGIGFSVFVVIVAALNLVL